MCPRPVSRLGPKPPASTRKRPTSERVSRFALVLFEPYKKASSGECVGDFNESVP
jgi:hypothetical protein